MTRTPPVRVCRSSTGRLTLVGHLGTQGVYVLRILLDEPATVIFGRFKGCKPIALRPGEYAYVGSAQAIRGRMSLAGRLLDHATRAALQPPHKIRDWLAATFCRLKLMAAHAGPRDEKVNFYNVDYLLELPGARLVEVFAACTRLDVEFRLADLVAADAGVTVFERGLGAADNAGGTHLVRVDAGEPWWRSMHARLQRVALLGEAAFVYGAKFNALPEPAPLSARNLVTLLNMHPSRGGDVLTRLAAGVSFSRAERESGRAGVFDTLDWREVLSRLARARGAVALTAAVLTKRKGSLLRDADCRRTIAAHASELKAEVARLERLVNRATTTPSERRRRHRTGAVKREHPHRQPLTLNQLTGKLRKSLTDLRKCVRDVPRMADHLFDPPVLTESEQTQARTQLVEIASVANRLLRLCHTA